MAARIIRYRDRLGGFVRVNQLMEVYGLEENVYTSISSRIRVDSTRIIKIKLNEIDYDALRKHPYLNAYQAKNLIKYRTARKIRNSDELEKNNLIPKEVLRKIEAYLSLE
jgi:competence protein ComEA